MLVAVLIACTSSKPEGDDTATQSPACTGPGALSLTVRMEADFIAGMEDPPVGSFRGSVFRDEDADGLGPKDGVTSLLDFEITDVDLTVDGGPDTDAFVTEPLDPQRVWVLGCLDVDDNDCDTDDVVTIPGENKVDVLCGEPTPFEIFLGITQP